MKKIILLLILLPILGFAEEYNLEDLVNIGLEKSVDMQAANISYENSASATRMSWFDLLPSLSASVSTTKSLIPKSDWVKNSGISLNKSLISGNPEYLSIKKSLINLQKSKLSRQNNRKKIVYNIVSKYLAVLEARRKLEIKKQNLVLQEKIFKQIKIQYESGEKSLLDLKQSKLTLLNNRISLKEAENTLSEVRADLFSYLNLEDKNYPLREVALEIDSTEVEFQENLELKMQRKDLAKEKISLLQQKLNFFPTISLQYDYGYTKGFSAGLTEFDKYDKSESISLNASYSIFNLADTREAYRQAKRNYRLSEIYLAEKEKNLKLQITNLDKDISTLRQTYKLYKERKNLAEENLQMAQSQYKLGIISLLDLEKSKLDFQNAQLSFTEQHYNLLRKQEERNNLLSKKILKRW